MAPKFGPLADFWKVRFPEIGVFAHMPIQMGVKNGGGQKPTLLNGHMCKMGGRKIGGRDLKSRGMLDFEISIFPFLPPFCTPAHSTCSLFWTLKIGPFLGGLFGPPFLAFLTFSLISVKRTKNVFLVVISPKYGN